MKLNEVKLEKEVKITKIEMEDSIKRRILDLGMIKGTKITPVLRGPLGDPTAYEVRRNTHFIKRRRCKKNTSMSIEEIVEKVQKSVGSY